MICLMYAFTQKRFFMISLYPSQILSEKNKFCRRPQLYWKRDPGTSVFLWILRNFLQYSHKGVPENILVIVFLPTISEYAFNTDIRKVFSKQLLLMRFTGPPASWLTKSTDTPSKHFGVLVIFKTLFLNDPEVFVLTWFYSFSKRNKNPLCLWTLQFNLD